jgi:hypothetical protein
MTVVSFIGQFFFQNDVFKLQEVFSELGIKLFLEKGLGSFKTFLILQISDNSEVSERFQKQDLKTRLKTKEGFREIPLQKCLN